VPNSQELTSDHENFSKAVKYQSSLLQVKRIFDMAPNRLRNERQINSILGSLKARSGSVSSLVPCDEYSDDCGQQNKKKKKAILATVIMSKSREDREARATMGARAKKYLKWLWSFTMRPSGSTW
jgi:hypothetical protein